jgi:DNA invertase Pin-like site-specific DNA recombinase
MPINVIYARKSSESEDRQVLSVDAQVREMKTLAHRHGLEVSEVLTESQSAKAPGRPVFDALMRRVYKGQIGAVLSWKMDRLARNHFDSGNLMHVLAEGLLQKIITIDGVKTQSGNDRLMGTMELAFATKFIDELRANTKRGTEERIRLGWAPYMPPPGYLNDRLNKTIISDPPRLAMIRRMFDLLLSGAMRPEQIRRVANDQWGFRTVQRKRSGGKPLTRTLIYEILGNAFYTGQIPYNGRLHPGKHEAIIAGEEFQQAQAILHRDGRQRPQRHDFAFTGLIKCGNCGGSVTAEEHIKKSGLRFVYYHCSRHRVVAEPCREPAIPERLLIDQVAGALGRLSIPGPILDWLKRKVNGVLEADQSRGELVRKAFEEALRSTEREIANLLTLRLRDLVPDAVFTSKTKELERRRASLEERLATATEAGENVAGRITELIDFAATARMSFLEGSGVQQRMILEAVGSNYTLTGRKVSFQLGSPLELVANAGGCSNWYRLVDDVRTWFLSTTEYFRLPTLDVSSSHPTIPRIAVSA